MRHFTYLALLAGCLLVTAPLDRIYQGRVFARPGRLLLALLPGALLFGGWDVYAISRHSWSYDQAWMSGVILPGRLPLEEALFFLVIPVAAILTYQSVLNTLNRRASRPDDPPGAAGSASARDPGSTGADEETGMPVERQAPP
jgi:lycopene cyclase domain-containing protein